MGLFDIFRKKSYFDLQNNHDNFTFDLNRDLGFQVGSVTPKMLDTSNGGILNQYCENPFLSIPIDRLSELVANLEWEHYRNDTLIENSDLVSLLNNPNPLQSKEEFIKLVIRYYSLYDGCIINAEKTASAKLPNTLNVLPYEHMKIVPTGRVYNQTELSEIISRFEYENYNGNNQNRDFETDNVIFFKGRTDSSGIIPISRIKTLQLPLSNIKCALESRNILINDRGARGVLSPKATDMVVMGNEEKEKIQQKYKKKYGLKAGKDSVIVTTTPMDWLPMTEKVKDLMLIEEVQENYNTILDAFGLNINIFSNYKSGGLNNNQEMESLTSIYQNTVIPLANSLANTIANKFLEDNERLVPKFNVEALKDNEESKADVMLKKATALEKFQNILNEEDFKRLLDKELNL